MKNRQARARIREVGINQTFAFKKKLKMKCILRNILSMPALSGSDFWNLFPGREGSGIQGSTSEVLKTIEQEENPGVPHWGFLPSRMERKLNREPQ